MAGIGDLSEYFLGPDNRLSRPRIYPPPPAETSAQHPISFLSPLERDSSFHWTGGQRSHTVVPVDVSM